MAFLQHKKPLLFTAYRRPNSPSVKKFLNFSSIEKENCQWFLYHQQGGLVALDQILWSQLKRSFDSEMEEERPDQILQTHTHSWSGDALLGGSGRDFSWTGALAEGSEQLAERMTVLLTEQNQDLIYLWNKSANCHWPGMVPRDVSSQDRPQLLSG